MPSLGLADKEDSLLPRFGFHRGSAEDDATPCCQLLVLFWFVTVVDHRGVNHFLIRRRDGASMHFRCIFVVANTCICQKTS